MNKYTLVLSAIIAFVGIAHAAVDKAAAKPPITQTTIDQPLNAYHCPQSYVLTLLGNQGGFECVKKAGKCPPNYHNPKPVEGAIGGTFSCEPYLPDVENNQAGWHCFTQNFNGKNTTFCQPTPTDTPTLECPSASKNKAGTTYYKKSWDVMGCKADQVAK